MPFGSTIHVSGTTSANSCGLMTNTVNVAASNEAESATGNNRAFANVTVACDNVVVAKYICVTDNAKPSVEFVVTTPRGDDGSRGCKIGAGVHFTITGPSLAEPIKVVTGQDGRLSVTLLTGDYTLTEDSTGASVDFSVVTNQPTLINVYNLEPAPTVEVTIVKFWCKHVENGVLITVNEPARLKGCTPGSAIVQLDGGTPFRINWALALSAKIASKFQMAAGFTLRYDHTPVVPKNLDTITSLSLVYTLQ